MSGKHTYNGGVLACAALLFVSAGVGADTAIRYTPAQSLYMEGCGGCHGILGSSSDRDIPELRGKVGWFMCTPAGREYIVRLPNVAFAAADDETLADMMNFVVFGLGGESVPEGAVPYSSREVGELRRRPLKNRALDRMRAQILADAIERCASRRENPKMNRQNVLNGSPESTRATVAAGAPRSKGARAEAL